MCSDATATKPSMPSRRSRKRTRKPKYLSLCRQLARPSALAPAPPPPPTPPLAMAASTVSPAQLDLSFLHPDHHERDPHVACLLAPNDDDANGVPSLTALLGSASAAGAPSEETPSPPRSASGLWEGDGEGLARRALRGRERWVFCGCSSASSSSSSEQEASSGIDLLCCAAPHTLSLKLDYEEILTAWSDRGSLYIEGEGPQVVPEIHHTTSFVDVAWMGNSSLWRVPDMDELVKDDDQTEGKKAESRQASVKRYKEKRMSRLFSKRIRYEVRKLNAEKRPRMKGRFVKRNDDV